MPLGFKYISETVLVQEKTVWQIKTFMTHILLVCDDLLLHILFVIFIYVLYVINNLLPYFLATLHNL